MLYLIQAKDLKKGVDRLIKVQNSLLKKREGSQSFSLDQENFSEDTLKELILGADLFVSKFVVSAKYLLSNKNTRDIAESFLKEIKESDNVFIFLEDNLTKTLEKKLVKYAEKMEKVSGLAKIKPEYKLFSLTDSIGRRNKQESWFEYHRAILGGVLPEEILGMIFWQVKNMIITTKVRTAKDSGLNPFVYNKTKGHVQNFSSEELNNMSLSVVDLYHRSRRGLVNLNEGIEKLLLKL